MQLNDVMRLRVPAEFVEAVKAAAADRLLSSSAYVRQAVAEQLKRDGIQPRSSGHAGKGRDGKAGSAPGRSLRTEKR